LANLGCGRPLQGYEDDDDDNNNPIWPTWVVVALFRGMMMLLLLMLLLLLLMMMITSPFGQLGLWAPSSGVDPRRIHTNHVCFHITPRSLRTWDIPFKGRKYPVVCRQIPQIWI
jgi:hypothetical protein